MEHVDQLLLAWVAPLALLLLQLQHQALQLAVLDEVVAQLVRVLPLADLPRHHLDLEGQFFLMPLQGGQSLLHHAAAASDHLLHLREVVHDRLVLLPLLQELQRVVGESPQVGVGSSEGGLELLDGLKDSLVGLLEFG